MELCFYEELPSTNRTAYEAAKKGAGELYTVVAKRQSAGRGRLQRSFFSPEGGTYFSTVLRPKMPLSQFSLITPVAAVAVHKAIYNITGVVCEIKWINDLLVKRKKICGILAESGVDQNGEPFVILGIGINTAPVSFPPELWDTADFVPCEDRLALIGAILAELSPYREMIESSSWLDHYREYCTFLGEEVLVINGEERRVATALDILPDGALRVDFGEGEIGELRGGEISLRLSQKHE